ncbi:cytosol aminopeptidase family, catalytic domain-containing protein [Cokeromyces recurvatus]|uniref:cytosol aminopeptidase family, catalytic domain-containing protein n=1 Tax=Cokeromyces recurvatus TaxID=90255 RepID=UPI0022207D12|nr:cytosol aminopeptidase family, catalytic domain-containing protein [Cokeromyces recurvatus]KAI7902628.1 cytosol aminopeptidase family, catalytic domain-containing protein [Cokeromyces recurvatus]
MFKLRTTGIVLSRQFALHQQRLVSKRFFTNTQGYDALVLGAYTSKDGIARLTATQDISQQTKHLIEDQLKLSNFKKAGDVRTLYNVGGIKQVAVVSVGSQTNTRDEKEAARRATALGLHALKPQGAKHIGVDISLSAHGAGEGSVLGQFSFNKLKSKKEDQVDMIVGPFSKQTQSSEDHLSWETGRIYGASQNVARMLMTTPANLMTPKLFSEEVAYLLAGLENVEVLVRDEEWVARQKMNAFLSVAKGSLEPLRFLEIHYKGGKKDEKPHGFVGKGITFDAGGISLKPSNNMALMKGDMGGAATVVGALYGICKLQLPINIVAAIPLCENLPSGTATKPGDVIKAMNGKSIEIIDTDAEGRLVLADALYYLSSKYSPKSLIDLATLTGAIDVALGDVYAGVFTNSDKLWHSLEKAGRATADPFWRMPLSDGYLKEMQESTVADLNNLGKGRSGGACSAAAFLKEFVSEENNSTPWAHIDIAGVMDSQSTDGYHIKGMSGRPTRSLIEYIHNLS